MKLEKLEQSRLNVQEKTRSNIFRWRGQFTPQFVEYLLDKYSKQNDITFDPFCGSGTVLLESARKNLMSIGYEINPAAYAMTKFITLSELSDNERLDLFTSVHKRILSIAEKYYNLPLFEPKPFWREKAVHLIGFAKDLFGQIEDKKELLIALIIMFNTEKNSKADLVASVKQAEETVRSKLFSLPQAKKSLIAELYDARLSHRRLRSPVDLIITSPPYINVFNYHENYRAILEILGFDLLKVAESEIGSNRKNRINRFKTVIQYSLDMEQALRSLTYSLRQSDILILVVGRESRVRGIPFGNSKILKKLLVNLGCFQFISEYERVFLNRFGVQIWEDILILQKISVIPRDGKAYTIVEDELKSALSSAKADVREDISKALIELEQIKPSPLFSRKEVI